MSIQWFPGHMTQARKKAAETLAMTDVVVEVLDARLPQASSNPMIHELRRARQRPCLKLLNKADMADPVVLARVQRREPHSVVVSARTGAGIEELLRRIDDDLPHAAVAIDLVVPYSRGDLVARAHREGELDTVEHVETGTRLIGRVNEPLAAELAAATA